MDPGEEEGDVRPTPRRYSTGAATRTPNDYNRGVQNATEAGVADNRRVLSELEEARSVQRRELAEMLLNEFNPIVPSLSAEPLRRSSKEGDAFDQVVYRLKAAVEEQRAEIRELRQALAENERQRSRAEPDETRSELSSAIIRELEALREQSIQDEEMIRYLQDCRAREAQVIVDWKKDILLWLKRNSAQEYDELPLYVRRPATLPTRRRIRRAPMPHRHYIIEEDEYDDDEEWYEDEPPRRYPSAPKSKVQEERLLEILEQGEKVYDKIMETSAVIKRKLRGWQRGKPSI